MTKKEMKALENSIQKWWRYYYAAYADGEFHASEIEEKCELCSLYFDTGCDDCPIFQKTGQIQCEGTPYWKYEQYVWMNGNDYYEDTLHLPDDNLAKLIADEIAFLESLRDYPHKGW